ncbi:hypothetical protein TNCV_1736701 [Trichonephila clavipes]|nr:hypothetical protein TNCV_1736701 [Trichonephila clavipes]
MILVKPCGRRCRVRGSSQDDTGKPLGSEMDAGVSVTDQFMALRYGFRLVAKKEKWYRQAFVSKDLMVAGTKTKDADMCSFK